MSSISLQRAGIPYIGGLLGATYCLKDKLPQSFHRDTFIRQKPVKDNSSVRFGMFGDTNAEKEAAEAQKAWMNALNDPNATQAMRDRLKREFEEADKASAKAKKLKKGVEWVGTSAGGLIGAGVGGTGGTVAAPGPGTAAGAGIGAAKGGAIGAVVALPAAHYIAEASHAVNSKEFKKGYNHTRKSGELCTIM